MQNVPQSFLQWVVTALGPLYGVLLPLSALVSLVLVTILVVRGVGPMAAASLVLAVFGPVFIGVIAYLQGSLMSYYVIANSGTTPDPVKIASAMSAASVAPLFSMLLSIPAYAVAIIGTFIRALGSKGRGTRE